MLINAKVLQPQVKPEEVLDHPDLYVYPRKCMSQEERPTFQSIQQCYPDAPWQLPAIINNKMNYSHFCASYDTNTPISWQFVQRCLSGRRLPDLDSHNIVNNDDNQRQQRHWQVHVIGERNSGTKFLQQEISQCFPRPAVRCHRDFLRSKHFFQPPSRGNFLNNIVIVIVRDPLDWVAAMHDKPYHMPYHMAGFDDTANPQKQKPIPLHWSEFLKRQSPWTLPQVSPHDRQVIATNTEDQASCVQTFRFDEVIPCIFDNTTLPKAKWRGHMPIYELQRNNNKDGKIQRQPFNNLLELRADKLRNFVLEIPLTMQLGGFWVVRYEDLMTDGTQPLLKHLATMMGFSDVPPQCRPQPPRPSQVGHRQVPVEVQNYVKNNLVSETEQMLGYR